MMGSVKSYLKRYTNTFIFATEWIVNVISSQRLSGPPLPFRCLFAQRCNTLSWHVGHRGSIQPPVRSPPISQIRGTDTWRGEPIYIWTNGGGEARPDQCTDIDTRSRARRLHSFWTHSLSLSMKRLGIKMNCWVRCVCVCVDDKRHHGWSREKEERRRKEWRCVVETRQITTTELGNGVRGASQ